MEELTLKLVTPIEELRPNSIDWNGEKLLARVKSELAPYEGITFGDDEISQAKAIRARLTKFRDFMNAERIRIKKEYMLPYDKFKGETDLVDHEVLRVVDELTRQINDYETRRREAKLEEITAYYDDVIGNLKEFVPLDRIFDQKWLNATATMNKVKEELDTKLAMIRSSLTTIEALHSPDETALKAFFFRTLDLASALMENERLKQDRARVEAYQKAQAEVAAAQNPTDDQKPQEGGLQASSECRETNSSIPIYSAPGMTVRFEVTGTVEELKGLKEYLQTHHIVYKAI